MEKKCQDVAKEEKRSFREDFGGVTEGRRCKDEEEFYRSFFYHRTQVKSSWKNQAYRDAVAVSNLLSSLLFP